MRCLLLVIAIPSIALAKPKVAVAPLSGDDDGKLSALVADAAASAGKVTGPDKVARVLDSVGVSTLSASTAKRLRAKLQVDVVVYGKARGQHIDLTISGQNMTSRLAIDFESTKELRKELAGKLGKRIESALDAEQEGTDDRAARDELGTRKKRAPDEEPTKRTAKRSDDEEEADEEVENPFGGTRRKKAGKADERGKRTAEEDEPKRGKRSGDSKRVSDDEEPRRGKKVSDDEEPRRGKKVSGDETDKRGKRLADDEEPRRGKKATDDEEPRRGKKVSDDEEPRRGKKASDDEEPRRGKNASDDEEPRRGKKASDDKRASDEDSPRRGKKASADEDSPRRGKKASEEASDDTDEPRRGKKGDKRATDDESADDDRPRKRKRSADDDSGDEDVASRDEDDDSERKDDDDSDDKPAKHARHMLTQAALWANVGLGFATRNLSWDATGAMAPPAVGTVAPAGRIEGEVYPLLFTSVRGAATGIGAFGLYESTFALGIAVPNTTPAVVAPISAAHYAVGARYRVVFGSSSIAFGVAYWRRTFIADRSGLAMGTALDMPDVSYRAVALGALGRFAITPKIAAFGSLDFPLMLYSGPIQEPANYGAARVIAFDIRAGVQIAVMKHIALQVLADFEQIGLSFTKQAGSMAAARDVSGATDRTIGLSATIGVMY